MKRTHEKPTRPRTRGKRDRSAPHSPRPAPAPRGSVLPAATASAAALAAAFLLGCGGGERGEGLSGRVSVDGSSTVYPVTQAMAEEFMLANQGAQVTVGISGTGGGFKKFCSGETDISDASREISPTEEELCGENGIDPIEVPVAWDGLTVAVNPANGWVECMTVDELKRIWQPGSTIRRWSQVRDGWPDEEIVLYGPDTDSGTFDYFTEAIVGEEDASRSDYTASADDNVLVRGVEGDETALGYFGFAYYEANQDRLKAVAIDDGTGCTVPTRENVASGAYAPLSRPLYIYVKEQALARPVVREFVRFYLDNAPELVPESGYVPLDPSRYQEILAGLGLGEAEGPADAAPAGGAGEEPSGGAGEAPADTTGEEQGGAGGR